MPEAQGNVFLTWENLAFSLPLIFTVAIYAYFTYIPLEYGIPALGVAFVVYQIRAQMIAQRNKKLENLDRVLDDKAIQELIADDDNENAAAAKKQEETRKKKAKVEARLAQEKKKASRKAATKKGKKQDEDMDDDDDALATFAKVSKKKKN